MILRTMGSVPHLIPKIPETKVPIQAYFWQEKRGHNFKRHISAGTKIFALFCVCIEMHDLILTKAENPIRLCRVGTFQNKNGAFLSAIK